MKLLILSFSVIAFITAACSTDATPDIEPPQNGEIIRDQALVSLINSSPDATTIDDVVYTVESFAWRDFAPSFNPATGLFANNTLIREDGITIDSDIEIVQHYIVRHSDIWVPDDTEVRLNETSTNRLHVVSREGPEWEIDSKVTVGLKIKNMETGNVYWLSVPNVPIVRTS